MLSELDEPVSRFAKIPVGHFCIDLLLLMKFGGFKTKRMTTSMIMPFP